MHIARQNLASVLLNDLCDYNGGVGVNRVADVLGVKGDQVQTIEIGATALEAVAKMVEFNIGSLLVTSRHDEVVGIFTERDYLRRIVLQRHRSNLTRLSEVMSQDLICTEPEQNVEECLQIMSDNRIRHMPVMDNGRIAGIISLGDIAYHLFLQRTHEVKFLTDYITGQYPGEMGSGL
jgi:CBS domain-containing protein